MREVDVEHSSVRAFENFESNDFQPSLEKLISFESRTISAREKSWKYRDRLYSIIIEFG